MFRIIIYGTPFPRTNFHSLRNCSASPPALLTVNHHSTLPPLAWLFDWRFKHATLHCGRGVETDGQYWFEGGWSGEFTARDFDKAADVFGSGGKLTGQGVTLVSPSHNLEPLFLIHTANFVMASNSLTFLLKYSGRQIDHNHPDYAEEFLAVMKGIDHLRYDIPCLGGPVNVTYYFNLEIDLAGNLKVLKKPLPAPLADFHDYIGKLTSNLEQVATNCQHPDRIYPYTLLTTVSKGYDSPACSVLAKSVGCTEAVTYESSLNREGSEFLDDNGTAIGQRLGLRVTAYPRTLPAHARATDLSQFFCDGGLGGEMYWLALAEALPGRALITGISGGQIWSLGDTPRTAFKKDDCSGLGLGEFRRAVGFAHIPLPYILSQRHADIQRISGSPEMTPWSVGGIYDRPIVRRIVEEAGIPRDWFGQTKSGNSFRAWYLEHWPEFFRLAFHAYRQAHPLNAFARVRQTTRLLRLSILRFTCERRFLRHLAKKLAWFGNGQSRLYPILMGLSKCLYRLLAPFDPPPYRIIIRMHPRHTSLLAWATESATQRYACVDSEASHRALPKTIPDA